MTADQQIDPSSISGAMSLVQSGGPTIIAVAVIVSSLILVWRLCGQPMLLGMLAFANALALANADLKVSTSTIQATNRDMSDNVNRAKILADQMAESVNRAKLLADRLAISTINNGH